MKRTPTLMIVFGYIYISTSLFEHLGWLAVAEAHNAFVDGMWLLIFGYILEANRNTVP